MIPVLRRVAVIADPEHPGSEVERTYSEETARKLGLTMEFFGTATESQLASALATMDRTSAGLHFATDCHSVSAADH